MGQDVAITMIYLISLTKREKIFLVEGFATWVFYHFFQVICSKRLCKLNMKTVFIKCPILSLQCSIVDVSRVLLLETEDFYILKSWAGNKKRLTCLCFYGLSSTFYDFLCDARF